MTEQHYDPNWTAESLASDQVKLLAYLGTDGHRWAAEFCKYARDLGQKPDEGWMINWFCNAIEAGRDAGRRERK